MKRPPTLQEAFDRRLCHEKYDQKKDVHLFSNGSERFDWQEHYCFNCWFYDADVAGKLCALEALFDLGTLSPELARMYGARENLPEYPGCFDPPEPCTFFQQRPERGDDGEYPEPPPPPDPNQLVLIADPTEDLALFPADAPAREVVAA